MAHASETVLARFTPESGIAGSAGVNLPARLEVLGKWAFRLRRSGNDVKSLAVLFM
jgi:hypothetical protein